MYQIAIVEDDINAADQLVGDLHQYESGNQCTFAITRYADTKAFLSEFRGQFHMVFMDILLPSGNGMDAARELRKIDPFCVLIFVTNMSNYTIQGYEVDALSYILKPITYRRLSSVLDKALRHLSLHRNPVMTIECTDHIHRISSSDMILITIKDHLLLIDTVQGRLDSWDTLDHIQSILPQESFFRVNKSQIINFRYVEAVSSTSAVVRGHEVTISRRRRNSFNEAFDAYIRE